MMALWWIVVLFFFGLLALGTCKIILQKVAWIASLGLDVVECSLVACVANASHGDKGLGFLVV